MPTVDEENRRRLVLSGAVNFRDLGGYPVPGGRRTRWRRIYRSDSLADLTAEDQERLAALGLRTLIDFRLPIERLRMPNRLPAGAGIETIEIGFVPEGTLDMLRLVLSGEIGPEGVEREVIEHYRRFPVDHTSEYRRMLEAVGSAESLPLLIHCTSGKDRTGFGAAVILMAVGVPREVILEDYALTNRYRRDVPHLLSPTTPAEVVQTLLSAQPKYLEAAYDVIDRAYGSTAGYLEKGLGLTDVDRARLVDLLTEPRDLAQVGPPPE